MILTDADQLREALRLAVEERDDALEWAAGARVALVKMEAQRAELRRQLAVWENASVAQLVRERDEARAEVARLRWGNEMACENTPTKGCECPGCGLARERAERGEVGP